MNEVVTNSLFVALFTLVPALTIALLPYAGVSLRQFSLPSLFIIFYLVLAYVGILPLYFQWSAYSVSLGVVDSTIIFELLIYSSTALIMIVFGFVFAHRVIGLSPNVTKNRPIVFATARQRLFVLTLFGICAMVLLAYIRQIEAIALVKALDNDLAGAFVARSNMGNAFEGKYWRYHLFFRHLLDYSVVLFFANYLLRRKFFSGVIFTVSFLLAVFSATMAIEKGPVATLLVMLYLTYVIYKGGNYWQSGTKYVAISMFGALLLLNISFMGTSDIASASQLIFQRITVGQITPAYFYLEVFPHEIDYLLGATFPNPGGFLPFQSFPLTVEISNVIFPKVAATGVVGSAPTVFWGEVYANFGPVGIVFWSFLLGVGLFAVSHVLWRCRLSPPVVAASVLLAIHYGELTGTSLSSYLIDITLIAIGVVTFAGHLLNRGPAGHVISMRATTFPVARE